MSEDFKSDYTMDYHTMSKGGSSIVNRKLKQRQRRQQRERQKRNKFRSPKQQLCTCTTFFCTFLCRRWTATTWNCLISRFVDDVNTRQRPFFSFFELWCSPLEFNSRKFLNIWRIERHGIRAIKFEAARTRFLTDVFVTVAVDVALAP